LQKCFETAVLILLMAHAALINEMKKTTI